MPSTTKNLGGPAPRATLVVPWLPSLPGTIALVCLFFLIFEKKAVRSNQIQDLVRGGNKVTELHQQLLSVVFLQMLSFLSNVAGFFLVLDTLS